MHRFFDRATSPAFGGSSGSGGSGIGSFPAVAWPRGADHPEIRVGDAVHLVGVGGAGMSGLARVMLERGIRVSGSDRSAGSALDELGLLGAVVSLGHGADRLPADAVLVVPSPAIPEDNPELIAARSALIPIAKRAALIGTLTRSPGIRAIGVAGTHGKTTTSAWLVTTLVRAGFDPTFFVGGTVRDLGTNARSGLDDILIVEADEYDRTFLELSPEIAVITTLDHDHVDLFPTMEDVVAVFGAYAGRVPAHGRLIVCASEPAMLEVSAAAAAPTETYAIAGDPIDGRHAGTDIDWIAHDLGVTAAGQVFDVTLRGECLGTYEISLPGRHSVANALAVIAAADALGVDREAVRTKLPSFRGAGRRFEVLGRPASVAIVDDYAHHPTEVAATIEAARQRWPEARLFAVLQPHTFSRVAAMAPAFGTALSRADLVVVTPVYGARESGDGGASAHSIAEHTPDSIIAESLEDAAAIVAAKAVRGDVALFMGAGDVQTASRLCDRILRERAVEEALEAAKYAGLGGDVRKDRNLSEVTSLKVGGPADLVVGVRSIDDLTGWARIAWSLEIPLRMVGRGTNLLGSDTGLSGIVILNRCEGFEVEAAADGDKAVVVAEGGVTLASLAQQLARAGWKGLEASVGIPGSVGASVATNAGAHGWEMADSLLWAEVLNREGVHRLSNHQLKLRYRGSVLKGDPDSIVIRAGLNIKRGDPQALLTRIAELREHRRSTQPSDPSVGSIFKNPEGHFAGQLIEAAGLKGRRLGGARVSPIHANFFINEGGATGRDMLRLIALARREVARRSGVRMDVEIEVIGREDQEVIDAL